MDEIESVGSTIKSLRPTREEIRLSYSNEIDEEYLNDLVNAFDVKVNADCSEKELMLRIINCTNLHQINFGGIDINTKIDPFAVNGQDFLGFARFQENYLATDVAFAKLFFIDLERPQGQCILSEVLFDQKRFVDLLVYLAKMDIEFRYRNRNVDKRDLQQAMDIVEHREYLELMNSIFSQYY